MLNQGIYLAPSPFEAWFVSAAHDEESIQKTIDCAAKSFRSLWKNYLIDFAEKSVVMTTRASVGENKPPVLMAIHGQWHQKDDQGPGLSQYGRFVYGLCDRIGAGIGYWLDKKLGTDPWLFLVFLGFGIVAAFRNLYIMYKKAKDL